MANKELTDRQIARIGGKISSKGLKMVAITYKMKIEQAQLDNITTSAFGNQDQVVRDILLHWRNSTGATVQVKDYSHRTSPSWSGTFDHFDRHCDGQNGLHIQFPLHYNRSVTESVGVNRS